MSLARPAARLPIALTALLAASCAASTEQRSTSAAPSREAMTATIDRMVAAGRFGGELWRLNLSERFGGEAQWLDAYGATAIDEFFAVACEAYFVNRERFGREFARLLTLFDSFFCR